MRVLSDFYELLLNRHGRMDLFSVLKIVVGAAVLQSLLQGAWIPLFHTRAPQAVLVAVDLAGILAWLSPLAIWLVPRGTLHRAHLRADPIVIISWGFVAMPALLRQGANTAETFAGSIAASILIGIALLVLIRALDGVRVWHALSGTVFALAIGTVMTQKYSTLQRLLHEAHKHGTLLFLNEQYLAGILAVLILTASSSLVVILHYWSIRKGRRIVVKRRRVANSVPPAATERRQPPPSPIAESPPATAGLPTREPSRSTQPLTGAERFASQAARNARKQWRAYQEAQRESRNKARAAEAEHRTRAELSSLESAGWTVENHFLKGPKVGDADLLVHSPAGNVYLIEVKSHACKIDYDGSDIVTIYPRRRYPQDFISKASAQRHAYRSRGYNIMAITICFTDAEQIFCDRLIGHVYITLLPELRTWLLERERTAAYPTEESANSNLFGTRASLKSQDVSNSTDNRV